jgi:hypothetical protein
MADMGEGRRWLDSADNPANSLAIDAYATYVLRH